MKYFNCPMSSSLFSFFQENTKCESRFSQIHVRVAYLFLQNNMDILHLNNFFPVYHMWYTRTFQEI